MIVTALLLIILFSAAFIQYASGFGFALVAMPLVTLLIDVRAAAPLVAMCSLTLQTINVIRFRRTVNRRELIKLGTASALGIPIGIWLLSNLDAQLIKTALGVLLVTYALYNLLKPQTLRLTASHWAFPVGFVAGCLGGAFNTSGPPVVVYGSLKQWAKDEFRATLQAFFLFNNVLVVSGHVIAGHLTQNILLTYLIVVPGILLGNFVGVRADGHVNAARFRSLVGVLILASGILLIL